MTDPIRCNQVTQLIKHLVGIQRETERLHLDDTSQFIARAVYSLMLQI